MIASKLDAVAQQLVTSRVGSGERLRLLRRQAQLIDEREAAIRRARRAFQDR
jgi:hypothetical protein